MSAADYDDTDMTNEEFESRMANAIPVEVSPVVDRTMTTKRLLDERIATGTGAVTRSGELSFVGTQTIRRSLELAGT